jgi:CubicO group peptidase (beta-lactamase class C family)
VPVDDARRVVERARTAGVFPAAAVEVGSSAARLWTEAFGTGLDTPFDLASLTKVVATTTVIMELVRTGALGIEEPVSTAFDEWRGGGREAVTVRDLLEHASGLPARLLDAPPSGRREFEHEICTMPLEYAPRTTSIYSDLGFILLGFLAADRGGAPLSDLFERLMVRVMPDTTEAPKRRTTDEDPNRDSGSVRLQPDFLRFGIPQALRRFAAPTQPMADDSRRGRVLTGEVHDNYAAALGGVAGHAGLFGSASGLGAFARSVLGAARGANYQPPPFSPDLVRRFTTRSAVPGSSRALGWDTMLPTSSCGTRLSPEAFGHVGYTGTSLWIDPARDRYFVLLTNRAMSGGTLDDMRTVRRAFHDALADV